MKYAIRADLCGSRKPIWREFYLNADAKVSLLTNLLFVMFRMTNSHLHHYVFPERTDLNPSEEGYDDVYFADIKAQSPVVTTKDIASADEMIYAGRVKCLFEEDLTVQELFTIRNPLVLLNYDYGDNWLIMLTPMDQEIVKDLDAAPGVADFGFLDGAGEGIIEDIGGIDSLNDTL